MKRKKFLLISAVALGAVTLPVAHLLSRQKTSTNPLEQPWVLAKFCDEREIRTIGKQYRSNVPGEDKRERLIQLLTESQPGYSNTPTSNLSVSDLLSKKIQQDFDEEKTVIVGGWVISITEARQCALFSMT